MYQRWLAAEARRRLADAARVARELGAVEVRSDVKAEMKRQRAAEKFEAARRDTEARARAVREMQARARALTDSEVRELRAMFKIGKAGKP